MSTHLRGAILLSTVLLVLLTASRSQAELPGPPENGHPPGRWQAQPMTFPPRYHSAGQDSWDFWYAKLGNTFHAFYLQCPIDAPVRFGASTVGLATSPDLIHWTECGEVLRANPPGQWNDAWVATGSVWRHIDHWRMLFTGQTYTGERGIGLATSTDLKHWTRVGPGPVQLNYQPFVVPNSPYWQGRGFAAGQALTHFVLADPYVLPEPIDGWYYMYVSTLLEGEPLNQRGCVTIWRSQEGLVWEDRGIVMAPHIYAETEAPQVWKHGDRWYLLFGAGTNMPLYRATMVYSAPTMFGPFEPSPSPELVLPDNPGWFYVAKVVTNQYGEDVLLGDVGGTLSHPYSIIYEADGSLTLGAYDSSFPQWVPGGLTSQPGPVVPDLSGGAISAGKTRINTNGYPAWGPTAAMTSTRWASDGLGGAVGTAIQANDVRGTRTSRTGTLPWGTSALVCGAAGAQLSPVVAPDGSGGAFFAWMDPLGSGDIYAQHLDSLGVAKWTANGVVVCAATGTQDSPTIVRDGSGGAIVAWRDARPGALGVTDVYAQRLNAAGTAAWATNGIAVCAATGAQEAPVLEGDGAGGAYLAWADSRGGSRDVYVQRIDPAGSAYWAADGILTGGGANDQWLPVIAPGPAGGIFVAWEDHRTGGTDGIDIYAQHVDPMGALLWPATGNPVCVDPLAQSRPSIVADSRGGIVVAWMDARNSAPSPTSYLPYAQRLDSNGAPLWAPGGLRVDVAGTGTTTLAPPSIASDMAGGIYLSGTGALHRVLGDGRLAWVPNFTPRITAITDVPADQGGSVRIDVTGPYSEMAPFAPTVTAYEVWRRIAPSAAKSRRDRAGEAVRAERFAGALTNGPPTGWELVQSFSPAGSIGYTVVAPTRGDSTAAGYAAEDYSVATRTLTPPYFLPSDPWSGYSVDNLAPSPPQSLAGGLVGGTTVRIIWSPNAESDLANYAVYKGNFQAFTPAPENLVAQPTTTQWEDSNFDSNSHYKVTAIDRRGNQSPASAISPAQIADTPPVLLPLTTYFGRISPNPMTFGGAIEYGLARGGHVSLAIYDLTGRRLRELVNGTVGPGTWRAPWDVLDDRGKRVPPGIYLIRFVGGGIERSGKVVVAR